MTTIEEKFDQAIDLCHGPIERRNISAGIALMEECAAAQHPRAISYTAYWRTGGFGNIKINLVESRARFILADQLGCSIAKARCLSNGWNYTKDRHKAWAILSRIPFEEEPLANYYRAVYLERGIGCPLDFETAIVLYEKNIAKGESTSMCNLALLYQKGTGLPLDLQSAYELYEAAGKLGLAQGVYNIGFFYEHGMHVKQDLRLALTHYHRAVEMGLAQAYSRLGRKYLNGTGVAKDFDYAIHYARLGRKNGVTIDWTPQVGSEQSEPFN